MLKNYFKIAWRNLQANKGSSFINIGGLAVGICVALLICLWINDELTFNHYHRNYSRLAVSMSVETINGATTAERYASVPLAAALRNSFPGDFKDLALVSPTSQLMAVGDKKVVQQGMWAEAGFPAMFTLKILSGNGNTLRDPSSMLISQSVAKALFGSTNPLQQTILLNNTTAMRVGGVYEDMPDNSSFSSTKFLLAWGNKDNAGTQRADDWIDHHFQLYVQLNDQADFAQINARIKDITKPHIRGSWEEIMLHPMDKWLLYNRFENGRMVAGRLQFVWLFGIICAFVLLLACINYMNLSTARSVKRSREVGIRKVLGSMRRQLVCQFMGESMLVSFAALLLALVLARCTLSYFNTLAGKTMVIPFNNFFFWLLVIGFAIFTGLLAGSYPALYLSRFQASKVLKGTFRVGRLAALPRRILVIVQFTVSIILITGTIIVFRQIQHARNRPTGYIREGLITVNMNTPELKNHFDALRNEVLETGAIENMAESSSPPTAVLNSMMGYDWEGRDPRSIPIIETLFVSFEFGKTIGWNILEGRDFSRDFPADSGAFILNEAAVRFTGLQHPVGKTIRWHEKELPIVGVVKDLVMESPYTPVEPVFFTLLSNPRIHVITIRIKPLVSLRAALAAIEPVFKKYNPGSPFEYRFTDEAYSAKFRSEEQIGRLAGFFSTLAIFISCLGLFGLSSYIAEQRSKEIGVRKILGASTYSIWGLLLKEFVLLVVLSIAISIPVAFYGMHRWLEGYSYRTSLSWWIFAVTAIGALCVTLLTVSFQAIKAAVANPVISLRTE